MSISLITFLSTLLAVIAQNDQPQPIGPYCSPAPEGSSEQVIDCYDKACDIYRARWNDCDGGACRSEALLKYLLDLQQCGIDQRVGNSDWITIWYRDDDFGVSLDGNAPAGSIIFDF